MALLKVIEWADQSSNTIVHKFDTVKNQINRGSALTVREGQVCIFCDKGKMADVFEPGYYKLDTSSLPILTTLLSWKYGFEHPFKSEVYFVNTTRFPKLKWGTSNPIIIRDPEFGAVRVRGYGTYMYRVADAFKFMTELSGAHSSYTTEDINDYIKSKLVMYITDAIGECGLSVIDMAGSLIELSTKVKTNLIAHFDELGLELCDFNFENVSLPQELEKALDENARLGMMRQNVDVYTTIAQADAMKEAAKNPGSAGSTAINAGLGMGMGFNMMHSMGKATASMATNPTAEEVSKTIPCPKCGTMVKPGTKFCPECGEKIVTAAPEEEITCPECGKKIPANSKFCPECGHKMITVCPKCGKAVQPGAKFCPECGEKL